MPDSWFQGHPSVSIPKEPITVDSIDRKTLFGPDHYEADDDLRQAVNAALLLDMPLLLSGEPGTGKTQLAEKLAQELGLTLFKYETKAASVASELFYRFDHIGRFHAAQSREAGVSLSALRFIDYGPFGRALLQGLAPGPRAAWFHEGDLRDDWMRVTPRRAVVLIDEIDKAPTDFPNDVLNELERHYFRVAEMQGMELQADPRFRPIVVITSNSEKQLPDAFLRRCLFHHLRPITPEKLRRIATQRLAALRSGLGPGLLLDDALQLFFDLRDEAVGTRAAPETRRYELRKKPSTAEFLAFVGALASTGARSTQRLDAQQARPWLATLVKAPEDQEVAMSHPLLRPRS